LNIISNAVKFTDRGGKIMIIAELLGEGDNEMQLRISITDTGIGIKMKD
jgi:signal transduction histidine kinase